MVFHGSDVQEQLDMVEAELEEVDLQIAELQQKKAELSSRRDALLQHLEEACDAAEPSPSSSSTSSRPGPVLSKQELQRFDGTGTVKPTAGWKALGGRLLTSLCFALVW